MSRDVAIVVIALGGGILAGLIVFMLTGRR